MPALPASAKSRYLTRNSKLHAGRRASAASTKSTRLDRRPWCKDKPSIILRALGLNHCCTIHYYGILHQWFKVTVSFKFKKFVNVPSAQDFYYYYFWYGYGLHSSQTLFHVSPYYLTVGHSFLWCSPELLIGVWRRFLVPQQCFPFLLPYRRWSCVCLRFLQISFSILAFHSQCMWLLMYQFYY